MGRNISAIRRHLTALAAAAALISVGCGTPEAVSIAHPPGAPEPTPPVPARSRVVVLGDSLAAGLGLAADDAFPAVLGRMLADRGYPVDVINAGVSGDTTAGGLSRLDWVLQGGADVLVIELGGNDGLRGQPLAVTEENLRRIVRRGRRAGAAVILTGMDVPTNYGPDYGADFAALYPRIAAEEGAVLAPGFVRVLGDRPELLQSDGLHPTAEGHRALADQLIEPVAEALLARRRGTASDPAPEPTGKRE